MAHFRSCPYKDQQMILDTKGTTHHKNLDIGLHLDFGLCQRQHHIQCKVPLRWQPSTLAQLPVQKASSRHTFLSGLVLCHWPHSMCDLRARNKIKVQLLSSLALKVRTYYAGIYLFSYFYEKQRQVPKSALKWLRDKSTYLFDLKLNLIAMGFWGFGVLGFWGDRKSVV